jgi:hypothetical protein
MTKLELLEELQRRNIPAMLCDEGALLISPARLPDYGIGITPMGEWLDCYAFERYAGSDLGRAGHRTLDNAIAWGTLLIVSCEAQLSAEMPDKSTNIYTSEQLSKILFKTQVDAIKNEVINSSFGEFVEQSIADGEAPQLVEFMHGIGGMKAINAMVGYWQIRDQVQEYQRQHGVSGLIRCNVKARNQTIDFLDWDCQLLLQDSDLPLLKQQVPQLVEAFLSLSTGYELVIEHDDESEKPTTAAALRNHARSAVAGWISTTSHEWTKAADDQWVGHFIDKPEPDKLTLRLYLDRPDRDDSECLTFVARHPDQSRFPWMD